MTCAVRIRGLEKRFPRVQALRGVDLDIEQGEFFALLGPNGAGKTTLISILAGLTRATAGTAEVMGHDVVRHYRQARRNLGVVPQELVFDPFFTVRESLEFQAGYFGLKRDDAWIDELLSHLALLDKADTNTRRLSGGMKRRVLVAQALVHRPPVIVLDEPTAGVDVELRQSLWAFIHQLNARGHTILLTTHYLEEAETLCQRVAMLKEGHIVALDSTANLLQSGAERHLELVLDGELPDFLQARLRGREAGRYLLALPDYAELEGILAGLRQAGVGVRDLTVGKPDLESVFLKVMREAAP
ncbi:MAG TPA: ABC transporter ATP-binding protein [Thiobacillaceae bacterium]|nr:ABC transporter ATP-binding protein [Thiobacillaceae bacterium]HNU63229.1 ABC transporter ATP-binding protein [Thiobacillaceae bacterium]